MVIPLTIGYGSAAQDVDASEREGNSRTHHTGPTTAPVIALLQDAMPRPGLPLVHFNDARCGSAEELRSIILEARRLADHDVEKPSRFGSGCWPRSGRNDPRQRRISWK
jgi:hypothetical protein